MPARLFSVIVMLSLAVFGAHAQEKWQSLLSDDFEFNDFSKDSGLFYKMNKEQAKGIVRFQSDVVRSGKQALELSVVPSCAVSGTECSERAEVWEKPDILAPYDRPLWYAFSFRLGDPIPQEDHRLVMAQWKREILKGADGNYSPFLALRLSRGRLIATVVSDEATYAPKGVSPRLNRCLEHESPAAAPDDYRQVRATVAMEAGLEVAAQELPGCATNIRTISRGGEWPKASSGWIDYVFMVKPDPAGNGRIEIAANGKWVATVEGAIGHRGPGLDKTQYFKFGPYRAGRPDKWTLYYDNFRRSGSCIDVASQALCASMASAQKSN